MVDLRADEILTGVPVGERHFDPAKADVMAAIQFDGKDAVRG